MKNISPKFLQLIEHYISKKDKLHLDVAQLIKHCIGLINQGVNIEKKPVLVYMYWLPLNWDEFNLYQKHKDEISEFSRIISDYLTFVPMSYLNFWYSYEHHSVFSDHIKEVRNRYELSIKINR